MTTRRFVLFAVFAVCLVLRGIPYVQAQTTSCPSGTYDMLQWMTLDQSLSSGSHLAGTANPLYTTVSSGKFYWLKGPNGYPWDIQLYDSNYIYLWITEYDWNNPASFKKFSYNTNVPFTPRCAQAGFPGSTIKVQNTTYDIHTDCTHFTRHSLKHAINKIWGPYNVSLGGGLPTNLQTLVVSYQYNCDSSYSNCADKEEFWLAKQYGLVQWVHYGLSNGTYQFKQKTVYNTLQPGSGAKPYFQCF